MWADVRSDMIKEWIKEILICSKRYKYISSNNSGNNIQQTSQSVFTPKKPQLVVFSISSHWKTISLRQNFVTLYEGGYFIPTLRYSTSKLTTLPPWPNKAIQWAFLPYYFIAWTICYVSIVALFICITGTAFYLLFFS